MNCQGTDGFATVQEAEVDGILRFSPGQQSKALTYFSQFSHSKNILLRANIRSKQIKINKHE